MFSSPEHYQIDCIKGYSNMDYVKKYWIYPVVFVAGLLFGVLVCGHSSSSCKCTSCPTECQKCCGDKCPVGKCTCTECNCCGGCPKN